MRMQLRNNGMPIHTSYVQEPPLFFSAAVPEIYFKHGGFCLMNKRLAQPVARTGFIIL
jgi:hypothetical protein